MKKKIKDLTLEEMKTICDRLIHTDPVLYGCNICPLRKERFCAYKIKQILEEEIDL